MTESLDKLSKRLNDTQDFCHSVSGYLKEGFLIEGKTMEAWKRHFRIKIPDEINFSTLVQLSQEIMTKYQRAAFYRDSQQVSLAIMEQNKAEKYLAEWNNARIETQQKTGKPLAAESCKVAATLAVKDLEAAISNQKVIHTFWVKTCDTLTEMRKLIELIGYALSGDARTQRDFVVRGGEH